MQRSTKPIIDTQPGSTNLATTSRERLAGERPINFFRYPPRPGFATVPSPPTAIPGSSSAPGFPRLREQRNATALARPRRADEIGDRATPYVPSSPVSGRSSAAYRLGPRARPRTASRRLRWARILSLCALPRCTSFLAKTLAVDATLTGDTFALNMGIQ